MIHGMQNRAAYYSSRFSNLRKNNPLVRERTEDSSLGCLWIFTNRFEDMFTLTQEMINLFYETVADIELMHVY